MKLLILGLLLLLCLSYAAEAELALVWNEIYESVESNFLIKVCTLANGDLLCFYVNYEWNDDYLCYSRFDTDGNLLETFEFEVAIQNLTSFAICESVDGGVILLYGTSSDTRAYQFSANGEIVESTTYPWMNNRSLYDMVQTPDGSLIIVGDEPDIARVELNGNVCWSYNLPGGVQTTSVVNVVQRQCGDYVGHLITGDTYDGDHSFVVFNANGQIGYEVAGTENDLSIIASQFSNNMVYLHNETDSHEACQLLMYGSWSLFLPNDDELIERYNVVRQFNGIPTYICLSNNDYDDTAVVVEVSEQGEQMWVLDVAESDFWLAAPMLNGDMFSIGKHIINLYEFECRAVRLTTGNEHAPVIVKHWLHNAPFEIAASGGMLRYRIFIGNDLNNPTQVIFQLTLGPESGPETVVEERSVTLQSNTPIVIPIANHYVPEAYPAGEYLFRAKIIDHNGVLLSQSLATFRKAGR
jgi:hypothetical protein